MADNQKILLESGNNEVEMLEFMISGQSFGINVAKVQTLLQFDSTKVTHLPDAGAHMIGHYSLKDHIIPLLNIHNIFNYPENEKNNQEVKKIVIVMQFNGMTASVLVDGISTIHRISWDQYVPLNDRYTKKGLILGSFNKNNNDIMIVDFEKIISDFFPETNMEEIAKESNIRPDEQRKTKRIFHIDDSSTVRAVIGNALKNSGYSNITTFNDGLEAYKFFENAKKNLTEENSPSNFADAFIIDIEMPNLDGLTLCKHLRTTFNCKSTPIIMFSSLIDAQMKEKCKSVGATNQIAKPEINNLVNLLDQYLL